MEFEEKNAFVGTVLLNQSDNVSGESFHDNNTHETSQCIMYEFVIYTIICGTLCVFGTVGNLIAFVVFQKDTLKTSTTFLFQGLSVTDTLLLVTAFPSYCITPLMKYLKVHYFLAKVNPHIFVYVFPWAQIAQTAAVWVTVLVGINRYIAVCLPYKASRLCSVAKARQYLAIVLLFSFLYNIPLFVTRKIVFIEYKNDSYPIIDDVKSKAFKIVYYNICYVIFMLLVPLIILTALNVKLIITLNRLKRRRAKMQTRQQQQDNNVTFVLIIVLLVFTACQAPALVTQILWSVLPDEQRQCGGFQYYWRCITNTLVLLNSAVNFVIYFEFNKRFRQIIFNQVCLSDRERIKNNGTTSRTPLTQL